MKYLSLILFLLLSACRTTGVNSNIELAPHIGESVVVPKNSVLLMVASAQISPSTKINRDGIEYNVAVNDSGQIIYISTNSPSFRTPEGLALDSTLQQVLASGGNEVVYETGWAHYSVLPSGWCAAFFGDLSNGQQLFDPPIATSRVSYYFKRK